jgi:hypothetical protein
MCCHDVYLLGLNDVGCKLKCCDGGDGCCNGGLIIVFPLALVIVFLKMFFLFCCFDHLCIEKTLMGLQV